MRTESRFEQYDLNLKLPDPLLPRNRRYVEERMAANGEVLIDLDVAAVEGLADTPASAGYESVAIGLLHSYVNDTHEQQIVEICAVACHHC